MAFANVLAKEIWTAKYRYGAQGKYVPSLLAAIGGIVERHLAGLGDMRVEAAAFENPSSERPMPNCPQCGSSSLVKVEGCNNCPSCGYSRCG